jgi:GNAT superfamily N-acetyltransferase
MSFTPVPKGHVAAVVTFLEMVTKPLPAPFPASRLRLIRWARPEPAKYRALFSRVGNPWLWFSRAVMPDAELRVILTNERIDVYAVADQVGIEVGILELDFSADGQCEIAFFGLVPELTGGGHGRWLMSETMARAWRPGITRVWVHTCTLDSPHALGFYQRCGFVPYDRAVEVFADPRLIGILPRECAPQIPLLGIAES